MTMMTFILCFISVFLGVFLAIFILLLTFGKKLYTICVNMLHILMKSYSMFSGVDVEEMFPEQKISQVFPDIPSDEEGDIGSKYE